MAGDVDNSDGEAGDVFSHIRDNGFPGPAVAVNGPGLGLGLLNRVP